jgi:hypothetical protein
VVGAGFIKDDDALLGAERGDDEKRLNEGGSHGKCRDEEPHAGRPAVVSEQTEHRRSRLGVVLFQKEEEQEFRLKHSYSNRG